MLVIPSSHDVLLHITVQTRLVPVKVVESLTELIGGDGLTAMISSPELAVEGGDSVLG